MLRLIEVPEMKPKLEGLKMELEDSLFERLIRVEIRDETKESFQDADCVLLVAGKPRLLGMERKDLLETNANLFKKLAALCNQTAKQTTKYLVVANPCNTNALLLSELAPKIPKKNISALSMLDQSRAQFWVANRLGVASWRVKNVVVYGNHSSSLYVDISNGILLPEVPSHEAPIKIADLLKDETTINELQRFVQLRGGKIIQTKGSSSSFSAAQAIITHLQCWYLGSKGQTVSFAVLTKGIVGFEEELCVSLPVVCENGDFKIEANWEKSKTAEQIALIKRSVDSLIEEKMCVNELMSVTNAE